MEAEVVGVRAEGSGHEWNAFVDSRQEGSFHHYYDWKLLNERQFGHSVVYLKARDGAPVTGNLPLVLLPTPGARKVAGRIVTLPTHGCSPSDRGVRIAAVARATVAGADASARS